MGCGQGCLSVYLLTVAYPCLQRLPAGFSMPFVCHEALLLRFVIGGAILCLRFNNSRMLAGPGGVVIMWIAGVEPVEQVETLEFPESFWPVELSKGQDAWKV